MTEATDLVRDLIAAGVDAALIARVSVLAARLTELDRRRASDANRQRRARSRDVTLHHVTHVTSRSSRDEAKKTNETNTMPETQRNSAHIDTSLLKEPQKKERKKTISAPLPDDWQPSEQGRAYARTKKGWNEQHIDSEGERFRNHSHAKGLKHADIEAAWRNWVTSPYQNGNGARAGPSAPRPGSREDRQEKTADALAQLSDFIEARADERRASGAAREASAGLLPFPKPARS